MGCGNSRRPATIVTIFLTLIFSLMSGAVAHAQVSGATISGTVADPSGAVVADAAISVTNTATTVTRNVTSDSAEVYNIPNLIPGVYDIKVTATGFSTSVQSALTLSVGQQLQLNFSLQVGQTNKVEPRQRPSGY